MLYSILSVLLFATSTLFAQGVTLNALEQEFKDALTGALLEGQSSRDGKEGVSPDKYNIEKVEKTGGDNWTFFVKIPFRGQEITAPLPLEVRWADDTPVIMVTDKGFPGMGSYTARVVVYKGHYAGTWSGRNGGGKVWGTVTKVATPLTAGRWVGAMTYGDMKVPFSLDLQFPGSAVSGSFFNGEERSASSAGSWSDAGLRLEFPQHGKRLDAKLVDGQLKGKYGDQAFEAGPYCTCAYEGEAGPEIMGDWKLDKPGSKMVVSRKGEDTSATIQQESANIGTHTGRFDGLMFALNHFDGARASILEITPRKDGGLDVVLKQPGQAAQTFRAQR